MQKVTLGQFITKRREELGYKKIEFSRLVGVGDDSLRRWEKDIFKPAGINARNLIKLLKFSPEESRHYFGDYHG